MSGIGLRNDSILQDEKKNNHNNELMNDNKTLTDTYKGSITLYKYFLSLVISLVSSSLTTISTFVMQTQSEIVFFGPSSVKDSYKAT